MTPLEQCLKNIQEKERQQLNGLQRFFGVTPKIQTTEYAARGAQRRVYESATEYDSYGKVKFLLLFFAVVFGLSSVITTMAFKDTRWNLTHVLPELAITATIVIAVLTLYKKIGGNTKLRVDYNGIMINNEMYAWQDVYTTAVMTVGQGKNKKAFLLIVNQDQVNYRRLDIMQFTTLSMETIEVRIAKCVEHYSGKRR